MNIEFRLLDKFIRKMKADYNVNSADDINVNIIQSTCETVFKGTFDCPPVCFEYHYGISTGWQFKKVKYSNKLDNNNLI